MELELVKFIKENKNWEEILTNKPYSLKIDRYDGYMLFKYNQVESDFKLPIVKESRGMILEEKTLKVVCFPFTKFFNVDEPNADKVDWDNIRIQEKIDGSLIKVWCNKENGVYVWHVSTNGRINAFDCELSTDICNYKNFGSLFMSVFDDSMFSVMNKTHTYMFELVSPYNKVVISYPQTDIYHIGTRDNITFKELDEDIGIKKPELYNLYTEKEVKDVASKLPFDKEGYVAVDKYYKRVKIKSPAYVNAHRLVNNHIINLEKILDLIISNDYEEFLSYFPEYNNEFNKVKKIYEKYIKDLRVMEDKIKELLDKINNRKDFASKIIQKFPKDAHFAFLLKDGIINNYKDYLSTMTTKKILERIRLYEV